jgi:bifunctional polynucleotide phosphatase/kinase
MKFIFDIRCFCFSVYVDHEDWVWWHETVPKKLAELHKDGYRLIIFTNQAGIEKGHTKLDDIKRKCEKLIEETNAPIYVFIATGESHFRKPATSMYDYFVENCNQNVEVSYSKCLYYNNICFEKI